MGGSVSEAEYSSKSDEQKKKERIRDNQRRSRARRQEHLADLEKRLAASHNACREAEMQRQAFRDVQIENARLRDLLKIAGVNEALTQSYVNQGIDEAQNADSAHRTIRPRIPTQQEGKRTREARDESSRASPYSDISAISRLDVEPELHPSRLSSTSLPLNYSPQPSPAFPMPDAHMQHLSVFEPVLPIHENDRSCYGSHEIPPNSQWQDFKDWPTSTEGRQRRSEQQSNFGG